MKIHLKFYLEDCFNLCVGLEEFLVQWSLFKEKLDEEEDEEDDIKEAFKMYDKDGDGYITKEEMLEAITAMGFVRCQIIMFNENPQNLQYSIGMKKLLTKE